MYKWSGFSKKDFNPLYALAPDLSLSWTLPVIGTSSMFSPSAFYAHFVLSQLFPLNSILVISLEKKESLPDFLKVAIWSNFNSK